MTLIDGKKIAAEIRSELKAEAADFQAKYAQQVGLAVVLVGEDAASQVYVRNKIRACEEVGIRSFAHFMPTDSTQKSVEELVCALADDDRVHGILVQLPLPAHLDAERILSCIPRQKDVDGFSAANIGRLALDEEGTVACTPLGVMELLHRSGINVAGKRAVVVGRSKIVGRPMMLLLLNADATVTVCHSRTNELKRICSEADILIAAVGKPHFITADMVKQGAVIIDVGINRIDGKLAGDVDFDRVAPKTSFITPVPGGVGPMTIAMLLKNTLDCARRSVR